MEAIPSQRGRQLHIEATRAEIEAALFGHKGEVVTAVVQEVIPAIPDVSLAKQQAENLLSVPLTLRAEVTGEKPFEWQLEPQIVAELINIVEHIDAQGKSQINIELDSEKLRPHLEEFAQQVYQAPIDARIDFDEISEQLIILEESRDGYALRFSGGL